MRKSTLVVVLVASLGLLFLGLACKQPSPAPPPAPVKPDDSAARAHAEAEAKRKAEEEARRKREAQEKIEEAARLAEQNKAKALQRAAEAALKDIHFDYDMSDVKPEDKATLQGIADFMRAYPQVKVQVEGHCDERGTIEYNIALGDRRSTSAVSYLAGLGADRGRFSTVSYGKERPLCTEANEACWSRNRRAHFAMKN